MTEFNDSSRLFNQLTNPNYAETRTAKLEELFDLGQKLAREAPDETLPLFEDIPTGQCFRISFQPEALNAAECPTDVTHAELFVSPEYFDTETSSFQSSTTSFEFHTTLPISEVILEERFVGDTACLDLDTENVVSSTNSVAVISSITIYEPSSEPPSTGDGNDYPGWPVEGTVSIDSLDDSAVIPTSMYASLLTGEQQIDRKLSIALDTGIDLQGVEFLQKLLEAEATLRRVELS